MSFMFGLGWAGYVMKRGMWVYVDTCRRAVSIFCDVSWFGNWVFFFAFVWSSRDMDE